MADAGTADLLVGDEIARQRLASGDTLRALAQWRETLSAADASSPARDRALGRYLWTLIEAGWRTPTAVTEAFAMLFEPSAGAPLDEPYWSLLAQLSSVLPDSVRRSAFVGDDWRRGVAPEGARALAAWWVAQDPYPATDVNERVEEHLLRVRYALRAFGDDSSPEGYDDRGELFVRFGAPTTRRALTYDDPRLVFGMSRANVGVSRSSFPPNEVWSYSAVDASMVYVLIARGDRYRRGQAVDLLPSSLRSVSGRGARRQALGRVSLLAMRYIFGQLATTSIEYGDALGAVDAVIDQTGSPFANPGDAVSVVQRRLSVREAERARLEAERAPPSLGRLGTETPATPYLAEATRYLDADGETRLLLTWTLARPETLLDAGAVALRGAVVESPRTLSRRVVANRLQVGSPDQRVGLDPLDPTQVIVPCAADCAYAVQMDLYGVDGAGSPTARLGVSVWDVDGVEPLRASGLEMSDLRAVDPVRDAPLVASEIVPGTPVSLYFEAYGFAGAAARVRIEYDVIRRRRGTLLRRTRETPTSGDLRLLTRGTTTEQYLILRTSDWSDADEVDVRVRVFDERTGDAVERVRRFQVARGG